MCKGCWLIVMLLHGDYVQLVSADCFFLGHVAWCLLELALESAKIV